MAYTEKMHNKTPQPADYHRVQRIDEWNAIMPLIRAIKCSEYSEIKGYTRGGIVKRCDATTVYTARGTKRNTASNKRRSKRARAYMV